MQKTNRAVKIKSLQKFSGMGFVSTKDFRPIVSHVGIVTPSRASNRSLFFSLNRV